MTDESTVLNNLRTAHYGDWGLDLTSQDVHELWAEIETRDKRVAELKAERKEFCPNCEAETPCTHEAELFVCDICGEDFAKYIVLRNCTLPDVSTTQDVTTPEPPEGA